MNEQNNFYERNCPFCGAFNVQIIPCNMFCNCGAKYYYPQSLWQNRNTGEIVYDGKIVFNEAGQIVKGETDEQADEQRISR